MGAAPVTPLPLLRAPPFPWADASVSHSIPEVEAPSDPAPLFKLVRDARVGGRFWADPADLARPVGAVLRPRHIENLTAHREALPLTEHTDAVWVAPLYDRNWTDALNHLDVTWYGDVDPWSVLPKAQMLIAHGDDEWVALARIIGIPVQLLSPGRFGAPDNDDATLDRLAASALVAATWRDPFTGESSSIEVVVGLLATWRAILSANRPITVACGMAWWKRAEIRRFLWHPQRPLRIMRQPGKILAMTAKAGGALAIWPSRVSPALMEKAHVKNVPVVRVEDGFVRSVGLGTNLVPPSSVVVDASGIHFDPSGPSDLETLLNNVQMPPKLLERARTLRETIVAAGISKYAADTSFCIPERQRNRRLILVPGQVEDDMSVLAGGGGLTSNLELLRRARGLEPNAEIWFRPHPDVDAGHRKGAVPDAEILGLADRIVRGGGMAPLLDIVDAVHVLTSLTGFEALMRGCEVFCHGTPFYAGWGLTRDLGDVPARRQRKLALDALVAGVLILYPRYLDPVTGLPCPPEVLISRMASSSATNRLNWIAPLRRWQGRLMSMFR